MSEVTTVVLTCYFDDDEAPSAVNAALHRMGYAFGLFNTAEMVRCDKRVELGVWVGAFNHLFADDLIAAVCSAPWKYQNSVALTLQFEERNQDYYRFHGNELTLKHRLSIYPN